MKTFKVSLLEKDLDQLFEESSIVGDKNDSRVITVLAQHLLNNGFNGVNVEEYPQEQKLPVGFVEKHADMAKNSHMFGKTVEDLTRQELFATIGYLQESLQNERHDHQRSMEMFKTINKAKHDN